MHHSIYNVSDMCSKASGNGLITNGPNQFSCFIWIKRNIFPQKIKWIELERSLRLYGPTIGLTELLYLNSARHCTSRQTEYECIKNTSCKATCCIRIILTIRICAVTNAFKKCKKYTHKTLVAQPLIAPRAPIGHSGKLRVYPSG